MLNVLRRRAPWLQILINPVRVQGTGAAQEIAVAIRELAMPNEAFAPVDLIVVTRGGGSIEDLWEFNEEIVARAIFHSAVPIVSAVGHEIDFTICDFVADLRAPTPSAAAELIVPDITDLQHRIDGCAPRGGAPVAESGARGTTTTRPRTRDCATLPRAQAGRLQARSVTRSSRLAGAQSRARTDDATEPFCRFAPTTAHLPATTGGTGDAPFRSHRGNAARARTRRDIAPGL